jgi:MFS family permease
LSSSFGGFAFFTSEIVLHLANPCPPGPSPTGAVGDPGQDGLVDPEDAGAPPRPSRAPRLRRAGGATGRGARYVLRQARRASHAEGAGETGLSRLIELHAFNAAGDAAVAISLAGTLFFQVPTDEARGSVASFLALTMLPFAVVAPLIGPALDRFGRGRRWAIGTTMAVRAFLCWVLADAVGGESLAMFPAALGVLVCSKAYGVTRAAAVPRLAPERLGLVKANSRISLAGVVGAAVSAPLAVLASLAGPEWSLRYAFAMFVGGTILAILLPARADEPGTEQPSPMAGRKARVPALVVRALRCNAGLRLLSGFLTLYMAFLIRVRPLDGWQDRPEILLALVIGAAGLGNTTGIALGSLLRDLRPEVVVVLVLLADTVAVVCAALFYGLLALLALGLTVGVSQALGKLSLDALIQREVPARTRASAFARSETLLQLSWVIGGFLGIALPLVPRVGLGTTAALLVGVAFWVLTGIRRGDPAVPAAA